MTSPTDRLSAALADRYRIERELGAGGMATVYLAEDLKHDRKVAIKVLKPELAAVLGADRFVVEIKTTAALQHPHILPLFDSGTADGFLFYVMPYIEGETIREKLNRETQFGVDEAVRIAREVADALDYAHRHGVIHRDIKPENLLLHDGRAMVMDFGIALAVSAAAGGRMTETGLSLGTPHYMSPEQATAEKEISPRSDVYSLASVLYEMLAGQPPHIGGSAQQVIMKIITDTARPLHELRKNVPPNVAAAVAKALEKLPADRFDSAKTFGDALANSSFITTSATGFAPSTKARRGSRALMIAAWTLVVVLATTTGWALLRPHPIPDGAVVRLPLSLPDGERIVGSVNLSIAISPQGDRLTYASQGPAGLRTFTRRTSELVGRELSTSVFGHVAFSPDGRWLVYAEGSDIRKVPVDGGASVTIGSSNEASVRGIAWPVMDTIVLGSTSDGLYALPAGGGVPHRLPGFDANVPAVFPVGLPGGTAVAFTVGLLGARRLAVTSLSSHKTVVLDVQAAAPLGMIDGHLLYVTNGRAILAVPFDLQAMRTTGTPVPIDEGMRLTVLGAAVAALSASGTLFYLPGQATSHLVFANAARSETHLLDDVREYLQPRFSPDGRKVAVHVVGASSSDIWVYDRVDHTFTRLTTEGSNYAPEWSPDGKRVLFRSARDGKNGIWWQPADGSAKAELLYQPDQQANEAILSPDGAWLIYRTSPGKHNRDIFAVPLTGDRKPVLLVGGPAFEAMPRVSPDGKWLAYQSDESGRAEIYVRPFPNPGSRTQVSTQGGAEPLWARSGRTLFYRTPAGGIASVDVTTGATLSLGARRTLLDATPDYLTDITHPSYDVTPDGKQFLMVKPAGGESKPILVHNWAREVREKLSAGRKSP